MKYTLKNKEIELSEEEVAEIVKQNSKPVEEKKVGIAIKNRFTGSIIFQSTKTTYKDAVLEAIDEARKNETRANLTRANLTGADLTDADLTDADLTRANLTGANLTGADLTGADLTRANLTGANLTRANLTRANLTGADLSRANLTRADLTACKFYMGSNNKNFEALCKAIKTIKWNSNTGSDFIN